MSDYVSNPNQRSVTTHKEKTDENNIYAKINIEALRNAMSTLTPKAFELWIYLSKNQDNHFLWLSRSDFLSWSNVGESSYYNAFNELKKLGYIVEKEKNSNKFDFYEKPREQVIEITIHKEK